LHAYLYLRMAAGYCWDCGLPARTGLAFTITFLLDEKGGLKREKRGG
jgi:hypothetical protein